MTDVSNRNAGLNEPHAPQSAANAPRLRITANGQVIPGALKASITSNNYYQCDHFTASFVMGMGPPGWWDVDPPFMVEIETSTDGKAWAAPFIGEVDHLQAHPIDGLIEMDGRDLSARFIEARTQEPFANKSAGEVVAILAARHGMKANIQAPPGLVGRFYEQDHTNISLGQFSKAQTEWDLLVFLAQRSGCDVFMTGATLNFVPYVNPSSNPYVLNYTPPDPIALFNGVSLTMERSLTIAKDVKVTVQSWNSRQQRSFTKTATAAGGTQGASKSPAKGAARGDTHGKATAVQEHRYVIANLTEDQALKIAQQIATDLTLHERIVSVEMPGELTLTPRSMVRLQGTGTSFDQVYHVGSIERPISFDAGFRQSLRLKNSSPRTLSQA